jgi:hypothetical protein
MLIFAWDDRWITRVLAAGSTVYARGNS